MKSFCLMVALLVMFSGQVGGQSTNSLNAQVTLFGNRLWLFDTTTEELIPVPSATPFDRFDDPHTSISPQQRHVISWEGYPRLLEDGFLLTALDEPQVERNFSADTTVKLHFAEAQWPLGERFAIVRAGIVTGGDPDNPNPFWMLDTNAWLIDTVEQTIQLWPWVCDTLVLVEDSPILPDDTEEFAVQCDRASFPPFAGNEAVFLASDGVQEERSYIPLYTRTQRYEIGWVFTPQMDRVAVVNRHTRAPQRDELLVYKIRGSSEWLVTFDAKTQPVTDLFWSPSGRYLGIGTGCFGLTISDCFQIRDVQTGEIIWDAGRLGDTLYGSRHLAVTSTYWLERENEFLLLGHFANEDRGSYIWHVSLNQDAPLSRWEVPSSFYSIVNVSPTE